MQTEGVVSFASMGSFANVGVIIANMKAFVGGQTQFAKAKARQVENREDLFAAPVDRSQSEP